MKKLTSKGLFGLPLIALMLVVSPANSKLPNPIFDCTMTEYVSYGANIHCESGRVISVSVTEGCSGHGETCEQASAVAINCANAAAGTALGYKITAANADCLPPAEP